MNKNDKVFVAGHRGMVGSAIVRKLEKEGFNNLLFRTSKELDLRNQAAVEDFFESERPEYVVLAAAKVGGILANDTYRADFIYDNLMIQSNVMHQSYKVGVKKLLFLGSSCIYPKMAKQPLKEDYLLTGLMEPTNEPYAIAKIAGIKMADAYRAQYNCDFISVMPTNMYGPNDNYDLNTSHVLPALLRKFIEAERSDLSEVVLWGTGNPKREFLYVDDLADACLFLMNNFSEKGLVNIGTGKDVSILELAQMIAQITGFKGQIVHDLSKPDGTPRKQLDVTKLTTLGWSASISLEKGLKMVYEEVKNKTWVQHG